MTTTRTDAHKIFANLYRKKRSPEHQQKVDEVIVRSNDVFIRIDLIKKLDEEFAQKEFLRDPDEKAEPEKEPVETEDPTAVKKSPVKDSKPTIPQITEKAGGNAGILGLLFGVSNQISKFAKESKALEMGLFGRRPIISKAVERIFRGLHEEQIISTIQALKYCEQVGWKVWNASIYNTVVNFGRFFNSFISLDSLFRDEISSEVFLGRSTKMQMYYVRHLNRDGAKETILKKVPELIILEEKLAPKLQSIMQGLLYGLSLEESHPTLTEAICAFHIVNSKKMVTWKDVEHSLKVAPIDDSRYNVGQEVSKQIDLTITRIHNEIIEKAIALKELNSLRKLYFNISDSGKISFEFLNEIIDDYISHYYSETATSSLKSSFKSNPQKLLQLLCRDFQSIYSSVLEGYIKVESNGVKDVLLVQNGLFFAEMDKVNFILRNLETFNRKFSTFQYTFQSYGANLEKGTQDQVETQLVKTLQDAADLFTKFGRKLQILLENHSMALDSEKKGLASEKILQTKEKTVEEVKLMQRFIPYYDCKFITQSRISNYTIYDVFFEMTKLLFNYAIIFKDKNLTAELLSHKKIESSLTKLQADYKRLTGKEFSGTEVPIPTTESPEDTIEELEEEKKEEK